MKRLFVSIVLGLMVGTACQAQCLTLVKKYTSGNKPEVSLKNKPNGTYCRLREEIQCDDLPKVSGTEDLRTIITERTPDGWLALYRRGLGSMDFKFIAVLYNEEKVPQEVFDLCQLSDTYNCEVQDIRWDAKEQLLIFNMACPSYAADIDGKGSKLFCYDVKNEKMKWSTPYLVSNDIFCFNDKFVFCSYGFTNEKKYVYMLDKQTGKIYSKLSATKNIENMELQVRNGEEHLMCQDYNNAILDFKVNYTTPVQTTTKKTTTQKPATKKPATTKKPSAKRGTTSRRR